MTNVNVEDVVLSSLAGSCNLDPRSVSLDSNLLALGVDSIGILTLACAVQDTFNLKIDAKSMDQLLMANSIADIVAIARSLVDASAETA